MLTTRISTQERESGLVDRTKRTLTIRGSQQGGDRQREFERSKGKRLWSQGEISKLTIKRATEFSDDKVQVWPLNLTKCAFFPRG